MFQNLRIKERLTKSFRVIALTSAIAAVLGVIIVALRTKRKIFSYKIQKPLLKRNLKKDA